MKPEHRKRLIGTLVVLVLLGIVAAVMLTRPQDSTDDVPVLRVIAVLPMTGPGASLGEYCNNGIEMAKAEIARRYGGKVRIEIEVVDSKNQPKEAVSALQAALARGRPDAVILALSSVSSACVPILDREGILTIVTTTALEGLPQGSPGVVRVYPTSQDFVEPVAGHMAERFSRVAIFYVHDDFGQSNKEHFTRIVEGAGKQVTASERYALAQTDSRTIIARVLATNPEAIFVTGYGPAFIAIFKQIREAREDMPIFTEIGFANPAVLDALGKDADGIVYNGTPLELERSDVEVIETFRGRYREAYGKVPYQVAGFAHDSLLAIAEASMAGGSFSKPTKARVIGLSPFGGAMGTIRFDKEGECRVDLPLMMRVGAKTVPLSE